MEKPLGVSMTRLEGFCLVFLSFAIQAIEAKVESLLAGVYFEGLFMVRQSKATL